MSDANVVKLFQPGSFADPLTEVLRNGARALLAQAIEAEVAEFLAKHVDLKTATGLGRVVRHGHLPEREVMTGIGPVGVRQPRVRDRGAADDAGRIRFTPAILPPYARRSRSLEVLVPILYLKGISTGDFEEALAALLGKDAPGLSASTIARLKEVWIDEHEHWRKRDLSAKHYVYVWADGIYLQARLEDAKQCRCFWNLTTIASIFAIIFILTRAPRESRANPSLNPNSLLAGKIQGISSIWASEMR